MVIRKQYSKEFKLDAISLVLEQGYSIAEAARLLKRVFDVDIEQYPYCGGTLKIIAAILESSAITKILDHLGLPVRVPPRTPAQIHDLFEPTITGLTFTLGRLSLEVPKCGKIFDFFVITAPECSYLSIDYHSV